jgi:hypothetical protein
LITASQYWRQAQFLELHYCCFYARYNSIKHCELSNNSVINASMHPAFTKFWSRLHYESQTSWSLHHSAGHRPNFWNCTTATGVTQLWCCVSIHIVNCLITQLSTHLHPAFMKFCCRLHYELHTSWSLHHSAGRRSNFWNCTIAAFMLDIIESNSIVSCLIT